MQTLAITDGDTRASLQSAIGFFRMSRINAAAPAQTQQRQKCSMAKKAYVATLRTLASHSAAL
jgi:hypothetical protein